MNPLYQQALNGTLQSPNVPPSQSVTLKNGLPVTIYINLLTYQGQQYNLGFMTPSMQIAMNLIPNGYYIATVAVTGSFIAVFQVLSNTSSITITNSVLTPPNNIGMYPSPNANVLIPPDSPRVLVGWGTLGNKNIVLREQYWERMPDSYALAPAETRTYSTTVTSGRQSTSSTTSDMTASLGLSASAGWGPVSASISSSLSASTSSFQQVTVTEQTTSYLSDTLTNPNDDDSAMYLKWQLTDVITVISNDGTPLSSIIMGEAPILTSEPYSLSNLPAAPSFPGVAEGEPLTPQPRIQSSPASTPARKKRAGVGAAKPAKKRSR